MRFFTNDSENKDDRDDRKDVDVRDRDDDHPEAVTSDPVPVPQQRSNSPWSSTPSDQDTDDDGPEDSAEDAGGHRRKDESTGTDTDEDSTPAGHAAADTAPETTESTFRPDGVVETSPAEEKAAEAEDKADEAKDKAEEAKEEAATTEDEPALKDEGGFDDPQAVDPRTEEPITDESVGTTDDAAAATAETSETTEEPVAAGDESVVSGESKPGEVETSEVAALFGDDAQSFQDRWRDVQLRFVDSPKEATAEAAGLVDEAVEKLTAGLRAQKDKFGGESTEDTEKLRVELRGYREILNRIIAL